MLVECWKCRYTGYKICHYFSIHDPVERVTDMLQPGLYEKVINTALNSELSEIPDARKSVAPIDRAEASKVLAQYLADVVQKGLEDVLDNGGDISAQIGLANQIVDLIQNTTKEADFAALSVDQRAEQLLALLREQDPRLAVGKTAADLSRPETSIAQSSLFTGAIHEPQMYTELKKEIVSADHIDMLVSFIKWSGLRLLMDELKEFTQNGGELRIITTSYMGATDVKAIEELRALPNTQIKVSYDTKRTRLHAKTYVFYRNTGFTTAYVGSSNLSNAAISSGLEWNVKVTRRDLPETIDKIAATFESYWNSSEFEYYSEDQKERLARALKAEKYFDANNDEVYTMDIAPYSYQQEILDKLEAERTVRGYLRPQGLLHTAGEEGCQVHSGQHPSFLRQYRWIGIQGGQLYRGYGLGADPGKFSGLLPLGSQGNLQVFFLLPHLCPGGCDRGFQRTTGGSPYKSPEPAGRCGLPPLDPLFAGPVASSGRYGLYGAE